MEGTVEIRLATLEDLVAIEKVGDALFDHSIKRNRALEFFEDSRHHLFLAFDDKKVVGMVSAFHYIHPDKDPSLFINEVGVLEAYQNQGIGSTLVKRIWEYARELGCQDAWVGTEKSNSAAQKCYVKAGGAPEKEPYLIFEFEEDDDK